MFGYLFVEWQTSEVLKTSEVLCHLQGWPLIKFFCNGHLFFMAASLRRTLMRHTIVELLLWRRLWIEIGNRNLFENRKYYFDDRYVRCSKCNCFEV